MTFDESVNYDRGAGFSFDFKGYDFGIGDGGDTLMPATGEYALIYYVDPGVGWPQGYPAVYVLGISSGPYVPPVTAKGNALGLVGVDVKIAGSCDSIAQIPREGDVNYPNGGKIWLVPATYLVTPTACTETTWTKGWPAGGAGILFETSLITYGFEPEP